MFLTQEKTRKKVDHSIFPDLRRRLMDVGNKHGTMGTSKNQTIQMKNEEVKWKNDTKKNWG
jgi:hypothetical protein